jgi:quinol monooxygenase YgiN
MSDDASDTATDDVADDLPGTPALAAEPDIELVIVTMTFDAKPRDTDNAALLAVLSKYIVLTRMQDGCRNVDLCSSYTAPGRHLIVQKWDSDDVQRTHFDSELMVEMARSCRGLLASAPDIDLWEGTSAHDLR